MRISLSLKGRVTTNTKYAKKSRRSDMKQKNKKLKSWGQDSNLRLSPYQGDALTTELPHAKAAGRRRHGRPAKEIYCALPQCDAPYGQSPMGPKAERASIPQLIALKVNPLYLPANCRRNYPQKFVNNFLGD